MRSTLFVLLSAVATSANPDCVNRGRDCIPDGGSYCCDEPGTYRGLTYLYCEAKTRKWEQAICGYVDTWGDYQTGQCVDQIINAKCVWADGSSSNV